jgi:precorrin-2 dehydrogenase/sirohydrochlorin ferrochelatase
MIEKNQLFPVFLKIKELRILLVGGGNVGAEKLNALLKNCPEAVISVVADRISDSVASVAAEHRNVCIVPRKFELSDLDHKDVIFLATDDHDLHQRIVKETRKRHLLTNVADTPVLCDFYLGSVVQKGNLKIGISTNGKSPTMAKRMREFLESIIPDHFDTLLENLHQFRKIIKEDFRRKVEILNESTRSFLENNHQDKVNQG